jgi:hypothetical protein
VIVQLLAELGDFGREPQRKKIFEFEKLSKLTNWVWLQFVR